MATKQVGYGIIDQGFDQDGERFWQVALIHSDGFGRNLFELVEPDNRHYSETEAAEDMLEYVRTAEEEYKAQASWTP